MKTPSERDINKKVILVTVTLCFYLLPFMSTSVNIAIPTIGKEFSTNAITLSWVTTSYMLSTAVFLVPLGKAAGIIGRKKIYILGIFMYSVTAALVALSNSVFLIILFRFLQGMASAMIFTTGMVIISFLYTASERGRAFGITSAAVYLGVSTGPVLGGLLTDYFGWRSIFWINIPFAFLIIIPVLLKLKGEWSEEKGGKFDYSGSFIYSFSLTALVYGFSHLPKKLGFLLVFLGLIGFLFFIIWEANRKNPILDIKIFKNNFVFSYLNLSALISYSTTFGVIFLLSLYLQYIKTLNPQTAGMVLISQPAVMVFISPLIGRLSDRIEPRLIASVGMVFMTAALFSLAFLNMESTITTVMIYLSVLGAGFALFVSPNTNAIMSSVEEKHYGLAAATLGTMRTTGNVLSMGVVIMTFTITMGHVQVTPEYYPQLMYSMRVTLIVFTIICGIGAFASFASMTKDTFGLRKWDLKKK